MRSPASTRGSGSPSTNSSPSASRGSSRSPRRSGWPGRRLSLVWLGDPPVPEAGLGHDEARAAWVLAEFSPERPYVDTHVVGLILVAGPPDLREEPPVCQQLARVRHESLQQAILGGGEADPFPPQGDELTRQIHRELAEPEHGPVAGLRMGTPFHRAHPRQELTDRERLRDVVVGAGIERGDLVVLRLPHGEHEHRRLGETAQAADHFMSVDAGEAEVEDNQVDGIGCEDVEGGLSARCGKDLVAARPQARLDGAADLRVVVDDQDAGRHQSASRIGRRNTTAVPPPGASSIQIVPPWATTTAWAMARPSPDPDTAPSDRKNGSKTRGRSSGSIPVPWSAIRTWTASCHRAADTLIWEPGGLYLAAFSRMFVSAWSIWTTSTGTSGRSSRSTTFNRCRSRTGASRARTPSMTSSIAVGRLLGVSAPARSRVRSRRFPTRRSSRSASWLIVCRSSMRPCRSSSASGSSWLRSAASRASVASVASRVLSTARAICDANARIRCRSPSPRDGPSGFAYVRMAATDSPPTSSGNSSRCIAGPGGAPTSATTRPSGAMATS